MYYRGASAAIVVYDITNAESFKGAKSWVKELQRRGDPSVIIALAGNKADLAGTRRKVDLKDAEEYAERMAYCISKPAQKMLKMSKPFLLRSRSDCPRLLHPWSGRLFLLWPRKHQNGRVAERK